MSYHLEGRLLEVCNCRVLCPCWIGEDPDFGVRDTIVAACRQGHRRRRRRGGNTITAACRVPGNILEGNWTAAIYVSDTASGSAGAGARSLHTGEAGGPIAELAKLIGTVVSIERAPITFNVEPALSIGTDYHAELELLPRPERRADDADRHRILDGTGAPVFVGKAPVYRSKNAAIGIDVDLKNHNALQSTFRFDA